LRKALDNPSQSGIKKRLCVAAHAQIFQSSCWLLKMTKHKKFTDKSWVQKTFEHSNYGFLSSSVIAEQVEYLNFAHIHADVSTANFPLG
jgi:hypothetical protein